MAGPTAPSAGAAVSGAAELRAAHVKKLAAVRPWTRRLHKGACGRALSARARTLLIFKISESDLMTLCRRCEVARGYASRNRAASCVQLNKPLAKKLKLAPERMAILASAMIEAHTAIAILERQQQAPPEALRAACDPAALSKARLEDVLACLAEMPAADFAAAFAPPDARLTHLERLAAAMHDAFNWTASAPLLKRGAELLAAAQGGGSFQKAWRAKPATSIHGKMNFRRGQAGRAGWLADALQGRIACADVEHVQRVAGCFRSILGQQVAAAAAAGRPGLPAEPCGADIVAYDRGLCGVTNEAGLAVDGLSLFVSDMSPEGERIQRTLPQCSTAAQQLPQVRPHQPADPRRAPTACARADEAVFADTTLVVYRVQPCRCCDQIDDIEDGEARHLKRRCHLKLDRRLRALCERC